jgi:steroid delta-isomerase-like uncharacterized protein
MHITAVNPETVRTFVEEYFGAWRGTAIDRILTYYTDEVVLQLPSATLNGKAAVREGFVEPFVAGFPGNVHSVRKLAHAENLVAVEWTLEAVHGGTFAGVPATGRQVQLSGCSFYEYEMSKRKITGGRIYFDVGTLLRQIGAELGG